MGQEDWGYKHNRSLDRKVRGLACKLVLAEPNKEVYV